MSTDDTATARINYPTLAHQASTCASPALEAAAAAKIPDCRVWAWRILFGGREGYTIAAAWNGTDGAVFVQLGGMGHPIMFGYFEAAGEAYRYERVSPFTGAVRWEEHVTIHELALSMVTHGSGTNVSFDTRGGVR